MRWWVYDIHKLETSNISVHLSTYFFLSFDKVTFMDNFWLQILKFQNRGQIQKEKILFYLHFYSVLIHGNAATK